jgi:hypothetical protein
MTKSEAMKLVALLQGAYPRMTFPPTTLEVYAMGMSDLPYDAAYNAVSRLVQTSKWIPTISEIREQVVEERASLPAPEVAWGEVQRAIGRVGSYMTPVFECEEIDRAVRVLGWKNICLDENVASTRARFVDAYRALREERVKLEATGRYVPSERQLPTEPGSVLEPGTEVPVYSEQPRRSLRALPSGDE